MNFAQVSGCPLAARFSRLQALKLKGPSTKQFLYGSFLNSSYKQIIESQLSIDAKLIWGDHNGPFEFEYRGVKEKIHAVAVINDEPHLVKVIIISEPIIIETLRIKYDSVYTSLQSQMALSALGGRPKITKSIIIAVNVSDFSVSQHVLEADKTEQENIRLKIDYILASDEQPIEKMINKEEYCGTCQYSDICENKTLPVASCSTCAFFSDKEEKSCSLGNAVGVKCPAHLYNPLLLVNHKHLKVDVQNLYIEYDDFVNCNSDMGFKPSLTSAEMKTGHQLNSEKIVDPFIEGMKKDFNAKIVE